jgi:phosphoribosylanthranilate isomerase
MDAAARPTVKICGIKSVELLKSILHLPIDQIGFVFAPSRRQVTPRQAGEMVRLLKTLRSGQPDVRIPETVGVFVDPSGDELQSVFREAPLDAVQLSGRESPDFCRRVKRSFGVKLIKTFSVAPRDVADGGGAAALSGGGSSASGSGRDCGAFDPAELEPYADAIDMLLLDTHDPSARGGTGKTFAWNRIPPYRDWARRNGIRLLVAGGLDSGNVAELIESYAPDGVDVSSGVETDGEKDIAKITAFVERVKHREPTA